MKFNTVYRAGLCLVAAMLLGPVEVAGQDRSLATPAIRAGTNAVPAGPGMESASPEIPSASQAKKQVSLTFGLDRVAVLRREFPAGISLWQYLASIIYVGLALAVSWLLDLLARLYLRRWAERTKTRFDDLLLAILDGPIRVVSFVVLLNIGLQFFAWPKFIEEILGKALTIVVAVSLTQMALQMVDLMMGYWSRRASGEADKSFDEQLFPVVRKTLKVFIVVTAALLTSQHLGLNITSLIASLSIGGLAVGLAAQDTLANLFGAVAVFMDKPFRIGDRIRLDTIDGTVEAIGMRSTRVRNLDGHLITVPNKTMGNATITNVTRRPNIKTEMNIGVTYDTPTPKLKRALVILEELYRSHPMTGDVIISFNRFADSSLNIFVVHWWNATDYKEYLAGMQEFNLKIKERFDAEGIGFAFPTQTVYVKQDSEWRWAHPPPSENSSGLTPA